MSANLYFAYSVKKEYSLPPLENNSDDGTLRDLRRERKKYIRACDACAIRKTKCDESRPCRNCYSNNLECTELRERKKMGPKKLRNRTLETIKSLTSNGTKQESSDLSPVADIISLTPESVTVVRALAPLTVPSLSLCLPEILNFLRHSASHNADTMEGQAKDAAMASLALLLLAALSAMNKDQKGSNFELHFQFLKEYVALTQASVTKRLLLLLEEPTTSATHYYVSLTELHLYGFFLFKGHHFSVRHLVHLRNAISNYQLISMSLDSDITGLSELRKSLYSAERDACILSTEEVFRQSCVLPTGPPSFYSDVPVDTPVMDFSHDVFRILEQYGVFSKLPGLSGLFMWRYIPHDCATGTYGKVKADIQEVRLLRLQQMDPCSDQHQLIQLLSDITCFKVLLLYAGEYSQAVVSNEFLEFISQTQMVLQQIMGSPLFRVYSTIYSLAPQFFDLFKCYLESVNHNIPQEAQDRIKQYTQLTATCYADSPFWTLAEFMTHRLA